MPDTGGMFSGVNSFPLMTPIRPSGMIPMSTRPDGLDHSACIVQYPYPDYSDLDERLAVYEQYSACRLASKVDSCQ